MTGYKGFNMASFGPWATQPLDVCGFLVSPPPEKGRPVEIGYVQVSSQEKEGTGP